MRIGIAGFAFSDSNKGCEALTYTFLSMLQRLFPSETIEVMNVAYSTNFGLFKEKYPDVKFTRLGLNFRNPKFWKMAISELKKCDLFFDATFGDAFSDIYGVGWNIKTDLIKQLVLKSGTPLILMPQTYGPFSHKYMEKWAVQIINRARLVYTRDDLSAQFIKSHCTADVTLTTDLAFKLPFSPAPKGMGIKKVGVNISSLLWDSEWSKENHFGLKIDYRKFHAELIDWLLKEDVQIHIIPHVINLANPSHRENDYRVCLEIKDKYQEYVNTDRMIIAPPFKSPIEAKSYISGMDVFIGARMHSTIAAISSGVATIPFSYSRKFEGLFGYIDYPYLLSAREITTEEALKKAKEWISNFEPLVTEGRKSTIKAVEMLDGFEQDILTLLNGMR